MTDREYCNLNGAKIHVIKTKPATARRARTWCGHPARQPLPLPHLVENDDLCQSCLRSIAAEERLNAPRPPTAAGGLSWRVQQRGRHATVLPDGTSITLYRAVRKWKAMTPEKILPGSWLRLDDAKSHFERLNSS